MTIKKEKKIVHFIFIKFTSTFKNKFETSNQGWGKREISLYGQT